MNPPTDSLRLYVWDGPLNMTMIFDTRTGEQRSDLQGPWEEFKKKIARATVVDGKIVVPEDGK